MNQKISELKQLFLEDHRRVIRLINDLLSAVKEADLSRAKSLAKELDTVAGPHIRFEEQFFYPLLIDAYGAEFVQKLYHEHHQGQLAIQELDRLKEDLGSQQQQQITERVSIALSHAESCGALLGHLVSLDSSIREQLLEQLKACRAQPVKWSKLSDSRRPQPASD